MTKSIDNRDRSVVISSRLPVSRPGPAGGKRDENRRKKTDAIVVAARQLFLARGISEVTIDDIVQAADMAKGSFYRYFTDKVDLVRVMFAEVGDKLESAFHRCEHSLMEARGPHELFPAYQGLAVDLGTVVFAQPELVLLYLQENRAPAVPAREPVSEIARKITRSAIALTEAARNHRLLRPIHARISALTVVGAVERLLYGVLTQEDLGDPTVIPEALIAIILDGIRGTSETRLERDGIEPIAAR